jgi:hypothetical protein
MRDVTSQSLGSVTVRALMCSALLTLFAACLEDDPVPADAGVVDAGADAAPADLGSDAAAPDLGEADGGAVDAGEDAGEADGGATDAGSDDAGADDAGGVDAGGSDAGPGDARLIALAVGTGATISPAFAPDTTDYVVTLPPGTLSTALTPTAADPGGATIRVDGAVLPSGGTAMVAANAGFAPRLIDIVVTAGGGAMRSYRVSLVRRSVYLKASNPERDDVFGSSIALSADGSTLAVGAPDEDSGARGFGGDPFDNSALYAGAVFVFRKTASGWAQEAYVKPTNTDAYDYFGTAVALSADGAVLAVGAVGESSAATGVGGDAASNGVANAGAAYLFRRTGGAWAQEAYVKASNTGMTDAFGSAIALSGDGTTLAVGATAEDSSSSGINGEPTNNGAANTGAVYVFRNTSGAWAQEAYVKASNLNEFDEFGLAVALSNDGTTLAVSTTNEDSAATGVNGDEASNAVRDSGAAYVFRRTAGTWAQEAYVKPSNPGDYDFFGCAVALSGSGDVLAVGANSEDSTTTGVNGAPTADLAMGSGAAYVFRRSGTTWAQEAFVKASNTDSIDEFGWRVALSSDGSALAVGAYRESSRATGIGGNQADDMLNQAGAAYVFRRSAGTWAQEAYVKASNTGDSDWFGYAVALTADGTTLAVSARLEDSAATGVGGDESSDAAPNSGAVYVF